MVCKICNAELIKGHIYNTHHMTSKQYYDLYLKPDFAGICPVCNKPTEFYSIAKGYRKYCSNVCAGVASHKNYKKYYDDGFGHRFRSLSELCKYHNVSIATVSIRLKNGWDIKDAIVKPNQHKIEVTYNGITYDNVKEACRKLNLEYNYISELLRNGVSFEDAVNTPKTYLRGYVYNGVQYKTLTDLCTEYQLDWVKMWGLIQYGHSIEAAVTLSKLDHPVSSYPEELIADYLTNKHISFVRQKSIKSLIEDFNISDATVNTKLTFDFCFCVDDVCHCIEYDGELHFNKESLRGYIERKSHKVISDYTLESKFNTYRKNDIEKTNFCSQYKIKLLRIHYSQIRQITKLIDMFINSEYTNQLNPFIANTDYYKE